MSEDIDWDWLVEKTKFYNSDDITNICREASLVPFTLKMEAVLNGNDANYDAITNQLLQEEITMEHMKIAMNKVKSSVSVKYLKQYEEWTEKHSST